MRRIPQRADTFQILEGDGIRFLGKRCECASQGDECRRCAVSRCFMELEERRATWPGMNFVM
jgi:hypothetical protein